MTDCGLTFSHDQHLYVTRDGIKICDGDLEKRRAEVSRIINEEKQRVGKAHKSNKRKSKKRRAIDRRNKRKWQAHD